MHTNYYSVGGHPVFFDDFEPASISRAYDDALELQRRNTKLSPDGQTKTVPILSTYRPTVIDGPWSSIPALFADSELPPRYPARLQAAA